MKKLLVLTLCLSLLIVLVPNRANAIDNLTVSVKPSFRESNAEYDISFVTGADLLGGKDDIIIQFPAGTKLPCSCPHNWHLNYFSINGRYPACAGKVTDIPNTMYLRIPGGITIKKGETVNVVIKPYSNIWNPSKPGKYQLTLWTTREGKVKSNFYEITSTHLKNVSVSVSPNTAGLAASYTIRFTTGEKGNLFNGQNIYVEFPSGTDFPKSLNKDAVLVNGKKPEKLELSGNTLIITLSHSINKNRDCILEIKGEFGISNPKSGGKKEIFIWTDNEPEKVEADFTIKAQYTVSTFISTKPASPDGTNGFFKTPPLVTLKAETNTGKQTETFYKIDKGDFKKYSAPFTVPNGLHTLYYYSSAGDLTEKVHEVSFKVDSVPPVITVDFPSEDPFYTGEQAVHIAGKVSEKGELIINKKLVLLKKDLSFSDTVRLSAGKNIVAITFTDLAGNTTVKTLTVIFDTTVPALNISSPTDWEQITTKTIDVKGSVSPKNSDVFVNGTKINVSSDGSFEYAFIPQTKGNLIAIRIKAIYPLSQKSVSKVITVIYKPNLPTVLLKINSKSALVNGKKKNMDVAPFIDARSNRTLVPLRFVVEFLGGTVQWDAATRTVTIIANNKTIKITIGKDVAYVNGKAFKLDQPAIIKGNRTFVPLRFVVEALGFKVKWNGKNRTVSITP